MVYDRKHEDGELSFEPSGGLLEASLVMRDRETDSWWSILRGDAIGGPLRGAPLVALPAGEKTTWGDWVARHPETLVLSIDGREHEARDPYRDYFASERTFRDAEVDDDRLAPKTPVYAFRLDGDAYAAPHAALEGGALFDVGRDDVQVFLHRPAGASLFASTRAWRVPRGRLVRAGGAWRRTDTGPAIDAATHLDGDPDVERLTGFDTFWYTWAPVHAGTRILR